MVVSRKLGNLFCHIQVTQTPIKLYMTIIMADCQGRPNHVKDKLIPSSMFYYWRWLT